jgi:hypothetical protein
VDAAALATDYMRNHPSTPTWVPCLSHILCQLELPSGSTNGQYKKTIQVTALCGDMWDYLKAQNEWGKDTISAIDWTAFVQAYTVGSFFAHPVALVKHFQGIPPTGKIGHQNDSSHPAGCPSCNCSTEDKDHVILCPSLVCRQ